MPHSTLHRYLIGLAGTVAGAAGSELTGSMVPLAVGASLTVIVTFDVVVRLIRGRSR